MVYEGLPDGITVVLSQMEQQRTQSMPREGDAASQEETATYFWILQIRCRVADQTTLSAAERALQTFAAYLDEYVVIC